MLLVPLYALFKCRPSSSENVQGATDRQVKSTGAALSDKVEVLHRTCSSCVGDWNGAPFGEAFHEVFVDPSLKSFIVCRMNQKLATVRFQH